MAAMRPAKPCPSLNNALKGPSPGPFRLAAHVGLGERGLSCLFHPETGMRARGVSVCVLRHCTNEK